MKKCLSLIVCLALILSMSAMFAGCSSELSKFVGKWETKIDMAEFLNEGFAQGDKEMAEFLEVDEFELTLVIEFNDDYTYEKAIDEDAAEDAIDDLKDDMKDGFEKYFEKMLKDQGIDMSVEDALKASGTSLDEMLDEALGDDLIDNLTKELNTEGNFEIGTGDEKGRLYLSDGLNHDPDEDVYEVYTIEDDELTFVKSVGGSDEDKEVADKIYPLEFKRVD